MKIAYLRASKFLVSTFILTILLCGSLVLSQVSYAASSILEIDHASVLAYDKVEIVLKDTHGFDMLTLWQADNYQGLGDLEVLNVLTVTADTKSKEMRIVLKTEPFEANNTYKLNISNLKDGTGNTFETRTYAFFSIVDGDYRPVEMDGYTYNNVIFYGSAANEVTVLYNDIYNLDITTVKKIENYQSSDLSFYDIVVDKPLMDNSLKVVLLTDQLLENKQYHIELKNLKLNNGQSCNTIIKSDYISSISYDQLQAQDLKVIKEDDKVVLDDGSGPKVKMVKGKTSESIEVVLEDASGFDMNSLWIPSNYDIQSDIKVLNVLTVDLNNRKDVATITLKTDTFTSYKSQKIKFHHIADSNGHEIVDQAYSFAPRLD